MRAPNTVIKYKMSDGCIRLSLSMHSLYMLWREYPDIWSEYNRIMVEGSKQGELDSARIIYAAYLCECLRKDNQPQYVDFDDFLEYMPYDRKAINDAVRQLLSPKK